MTTITDAEVCIVRRCAESAARRITFSPAVSRDAGQHAVDAFITARLLGQELRHLAGWSAQVGRNFAIRETYAASRCSVDSAKVEDVSGDVVKPSMHPPGLWSILTAQGDCLTAKQRHVLKLVDPGLSMKANARRLMMSPFNLRRMLKCIGRRFCRAGIDANG
jgi:hypothetical protein